MWANAYEAPIAALCLDDGFEVAHRFIRDEFAGELEKKDVDAEDAKSALQELLQGRGLPVPSCRVAAEEGPSHRRSLRVEYRRDDGLVTEGEGTSKKAAQQAAARRALDLLRRPDC